MLQDAKAEGWGTTGTGRLLKSCTLLPARLLTHWAAQDKASALRSHTVFRDQSLCSAGAAADSATRPGPLCWVSWAQTSAGTAWLWSLSFIIHLFPCNTIAAAREGHGPENGLPTCKLTLIEFAQQILSESIQLSTTKQAWDAKRQPGVKTSSFPVNHALYAFQAFSHYHFLLKKILFS